MTLLFVFCSLLNNYFIMFWFAVLHKHLKITSFVCISDIYLDPNEEQVHLTMDWIFFLLQHKYLTPGRWIKHRSHICHFQLYSSSLNALWPILLFQEEDDDVYLEPAEGKLHRTSGKLPLTVDHENQRSVLPTTAAYVVKDNSLSLPHYQPTVQFLPGPWGCLHLRRHTYPCECTSQSKELPSWWCDDVD